MTHLDLFSGIGGFALAAQAAGFSTIGFSEIEPYACKVLERHWPSVPNFGDIRNVRHVPCDLITGGFPCQPFSVAGKRRGTQDDRHLWPEMCRVIAESRPAWVVGENVPGIVQMELDHILDDLAGIGYAGWPLIIPALAVDARHRRDRVWIVAHANETRRQEQRRAEPVEQEHAAPECRREVMADAKHDGGGANQQRRKTEGRTLAWRNGENVADTDSDEQHRGTSHVQVGRIKSQSETEDDGFDRGIEWSPEPGVCRVAYGVPHRAHRLKGLGNAIVPQVAEILLGLIAKVEAGSPAGHPVL